MVNMNYSSDIHEIDNISWMQQCVQFVGHHLATAGYHKGIGDHRLSDHTWWKGIMDQKYSYYKTLIEMHKSDHTEYRKLYSWHNTITDMYLSLLFLI